MNIRLHKNATTTPARRAYIQSSPLSVAGRRRVWMRARCEERLAPGGVVRKHPVRDPQQSQ